MPKKTMPGGIQSMDASSLIQVSGFVGDSIVDGPGLRCTVFCQGCPHHCEGCHNPDTHPFEGGTPYTAEELFQQIMRYPLCKAVTLSGGEPFCQSRALIPLVEKLKQTGYQVAAYTGYTFENLMRGDQDQRQLLALLDTLIDGPFLLQQRDLSLRFKGSRNQRILDVPKSLAAGAPLLHTESRWSQTTS